jgi:hypothetical protein
MKPHRKALVKLKLGKPKLGGEVFILLRASFVVFVKREGFVHGHFVSPVCVSM